MHTRVDAASGRTPRGPPPLEAFSRDLLALIRGVRVYPEGHNFIADLSARLVCQLRDEFADPLSIGVTPHELTLGDTFIGGRHRRAAELAEFLHGRKVGRLLIRGDVSATDLAAVARELSDPRRSKASPQERLRDAGVETVVLEPLQLEKIHEAFREGAKEGTATAPDRGEEAWHWLLDGDITPGRVAELLTDEATWEGLTTAGDDAEAAQLTALLFQMGDRLADALASLPRDHRAEVQQRLALVGRRLSPRELAALLRETDAKGVLEGPIGDALEQTFGGDKLLDLLAGLVVEEGRDTRRLAEVYARFAASGKGDDLLSEVHKRMAGGGGEFTAEVWGAVESFLLDLQESPFMGTDYSATLENVAAAEQQVQFESSDLTHDLEPHLDAVLVGLNFVDTHAWGTPCLDRLAQRIGAVEPEYLLALVAELDTAAPTLLDARPELVEQIFHRCSRQVRGMDDKQRPALLRFAAAHEAMLLGPVFRALLLEENIAVRRFLVDVVAEFSPAATPSVVSRLRSSPWYVTRNLTIAMGRRKEAATLPVLQSLLDHEHAKVRREAIIALGRLGTPEASEVLVTVAHSGRSSSEDRSLATRTMEITAKQQEVP